jgi:hypothetical protein
MFKTIIILIIITFVFYNCDWFKKSNDDQLKTQVDKNTTAINGLTSTMATKTDQTIFEKAIKDVNGQIIKSEDRILALETKKTDAKATVSKKTTSVAKKNAKKSINTYDAVAGFGESEADIIKNAANDEIYQPFIAIPQSVASKETEQPTNLIDFIKKQETLTKNSLNTVDKKPETIIKHQNFDNEQVLQIKKHDLAIEAHRKTLDSYNNELKQTKDFQNTTESRLRVLEGDVKNLKDGQEITKVELGKVWEHFKYIEDKEKERSEDTSEDTKKETEE